MGARFCSDKNSMNTFGHISLPTFHVQLNIFGKQNNLLAEAKNKSLGSNVL